MSKDMFPSSTPDLAAMRKKLAPEVHDAFTNFSKAVFADGALDRRTKELIAVAVA
ncbi:MAG: carboxymuconolactone decarboxylase family protein, partial [Woeseiaceae bacterium]